MGSQLVGFVGNELVPNGRGSIGSVSVSRPGQCRSVCVGGGTQARAWGGGTHRHGVEVHTGVGWRYTQAWGGGTHRHGVEVHAGMGWRYTQAWGGGTHRHGVEVHTTHRHGVEFRVRVMGVGRPELICRDRLSHQLGFRP